MTKDPMATEFVRLLELTAEYMTASEAVIDGLLGKLDIKDRSEAEVEIRRRVRVYGDVRRELGTYAREREAMLA